MRRTLEPIAGETRRADELKIGDSVFIDGEWIMVYEIDQPSRQIVVSYSGEGKKYLPPEKHYRVR